MKIVKFKGGIGNQLFQYAFLRSIQCSSSIAVKADLFQYDHNFNSINVYKLDKFNAKLDVANNIDISKVCKINNKAVPTGYMYKVKVLLEIMVNKKYYFEWSRLYREIDINSYDYFDGYWQCEKYFSEIRDVLINEISLKSISKKTNKIINQIKKQNTVFIGVRRPYSFESDNMQKTLNAVSNNIQYYHNAIDYINERVMNPVYIVFSNDIDWVKQNLNLNGNVIYRTKEEQVSDEEELMIMRSCKHAIISNSTFNWWGAWLIENDNKIVISPHTWRQNYKSDIIPNSWILM